MERTVKSQWKRILLIIIASFITAINIKTFVRTGGLVPGGFTGLTLLIQRLGLMYLHIELPFTVINFSLNAIPVVISYKFIGKRFTLYSCLMIGLTGILADILPASPLTYDVWLISMFGGVINGFAVSLCLMAGATSGGTDFIAILFSEKYNLEIWNYILFANAIMIIISGTIFGWDKALYSIFFQYSSTQVVKMLHLRYKRHTLFIITNHPDEVYEKIESCSNHGATVFKGTGCYQHESRDMVYSVVSSEEVKKVIAKVREADKDAFINVVKTDHLEGRFYLRPTD